MLFYVGFSGTRVNNKTNVKPSDDDINIYIYIVQGVCEVRADFLINILTHLFFRDMVIPLAARSYG